MDKSRLQEWKDKRAHRKRSLNHDDLFSGIRSGDLTALSGAITLLESSKPENQETAKHLITSCLPFSGNSIRIGITGVPGVGKSTFIESFGQYVLAQNKKLAVLAIDPSSEKSGGSILGDKTRMQNLSQAANTFIRPSPAGKSLGGVARKTRESIILCEAAGFDYVLIETVGVGQSETAVQSMVDFFLLLMLAGAGDELQGIKRGIMEMADAIVITKADGENKLNAQKASVQYRNALHLFPANASGWQPQVLTSSALENQNLDKIYQVIASFENQTKINGYFKTKRQDQDRYWLHETITDFLVSNFYNNQKIKSHLKKLEQDIKQGKTTSFAAADVLLDIYFSKK